MYELQTLDEDGWIGVHSSADLAELVDMGRDLEQWVTNPLRVIEREAA